MTIKPGMVRLSSYGGPGAGLIAAMQLQPTVQSRGPPFSLCSGCRFKLLLLLTLPHIRPLGAFGLDFGGWSLLSLGDHRHDQRAHEKHRSAYGNEFFHLPPSVQSPLWGIARLSGCDHFK